MTAMLPHQQSAIATVKKIPPLENGDALNRREFERRNGVQEYLVWQVIEEKFDWFMLTEGE
jgi:hypothetical protein